MPNHSTITLPDNTTHEDVAKVLTTELKEKFGFNPTSNWDSEHHFLEITVRGVILGCWIENSTLTFYDTSDSALYQLNDRDSEYCIRPLMEQTAGLFSLLLGYSYLHHYSIHFLVQHFNSLVNSDGAGPLTPFEGPVRYDSFDTWFTFMSQGLKGRGPIQRVLFGTQSVEQFKTAELAYFPELETTTLKKRN